MSLVAIFLSAILGYVWMGEGGAIAFALGGLWGTYGAARPWRMGRSGAGLVMAWATLTPTLLWTVGTLRPDFSAHLLLFLGPVLDRVLDFTLADNRAYGVLSSHGLLNRMPTIRVGVGVSWLCALPAAAAIALWYDGRPAIRWRGGGRHGDPMAVLFVGLTLLAVSATLLVGGFGFGDGRRSLSFGFGMVLYPLLVLVWLCGVVSVRAWANWWFATHQPGRAPIP